MNIRLGIILLITPLWVLGKTAEHVKTPLLPEVEKILDMSAIHAENMDKNAFVGLSVIEAPASMDPMEIGKIVIQKNIEHYKKAVAERDYERTYKTERLTPYFNHQQPLDLSVYRDKYREFYCANLADKECLAKVMQERTAIEQVIANNPLPLERYKKYITLPFYNTYLSNGLEFYVLMDLYRLSNYHVRQAIYAIKDNRIDEGLDMLLAELNFYKQILRNHQQYTTNVELVIVTQRLFAIYHTIERLLDDPRMQDQLNNPKLIHLLASMSGQEQTILSTVFKNVREESIRLVYMIEPEEPSAYDQAKMQELGLSLTYDKEQTMNDYYLLMEGYIKAGQLSLPKSKDYYQQHILQPEKIQQQIKTMCEPNNGVGCYYLQSTTDLFKTFTNFYDVIGYLALVQLKLEIKQQGITEEAITQFLKLQGEKAANPYSDEPFQWDKETKSLSFKWLDQRINYIKAKPHAVIYLDFSTERKSL